jgi:hypothetical protein
MSNLPNVKKSLDDLNIFELHRRNSSYYYNCSPVKSCPSYELDEQYCYCHLNQLVCPVEIGFKYCKPSLKSKIYIEIGENCPICLDSINNMSNAYLTSCCHVAFHRMCLTKAHDYHSTIKISQFVCPTCRESIPDEIYLTKYTPRLSTNLDKLENFWNSIDYLPINYCVFSYYLNKKHYTHPVGFDKLCTFCDEYKKTGKY